MLLGARLLLYFLALNKIPGGWKLWSRQSRTLSPVSSGLTTKSPHSPD
jgi:hypothetical protein